MVLIRQAGGKWHEPESSKYDNEKHLQELVKLTPTLLPGGDELAIVAELSIPGVGFVDLVGVGSDGRIVVVECKLKANPEIRREVVGQVLSYAGGLWRMGHDQFEAAFADRAGMSLYEAVKQATATELDEIQLRAAVAANLKSGSFRLVVAIDEITAELRTIIEYLNGHTLDSVQVLALELRYSKDSDVELLTPNVYGEEAAEKKTKEASGSKWNATTFAAAMQQRATPAEVDFLNSVIEHGRTKGHHLYYGSGVMPGMSGYYAIDDVPTSVWAIYLHDAGPKLALSLGSITSKSSPERTLGWLTELRSDPILQGLLATITSDDLHKYPQLAVASLTAPATQNAFVKSLDAFAS